MKPNPRVWLLLVAVLVTTPACDQTGQVDKSAKALKTKLVGADLTAQQVIDACKQAYRDLNSYEDDGFVRLVYNHQGQPTEDRAPLAIAFHKPGMLGIRAYNVEAGPTNGRWYLKLNQTEGSAIAGQVVSRAIPTKADFHWLLNDPAISDELAAGLAGFPPQLDMLLSSDPMQGLIGEASSVSLDLPDYIDDKKCYVVRVTRNGAEYRMWIEQQSMLMRRLMIPNANLAPEMLADKNVSNIQLTIEFAKIRTNLPIAWKRFEVATAPTSMLVNRFVPAPPPLPTSNLGTKLPAFRFRDHRGLEAFSSSTADKITVLAWLADHPACRTTVAQLAEIEAIVAASPLRDQVQFVSVWAEPTTPNNVRFEQLQQQWKIPGILVIDQEAIGRDLFNVREAPTVVVLSSDHRLQIFEERANPFLVQLLPDLLKRLVSGEDLAAEVLRNANADRQRHIAELWMSAAVDANRENFQKPVAYRPQLIAISQPQPHDLRLGSDTEIVAISVDADQLLWTLTSDGKLNRQDPGSGSSQSFRTPWKLENARAARIEVAPGGRFVGMVSANGNSISMFDTSSEQNRDIRLPSGEKAVDFAWVSLAAAKTPRLAVLTSNSETKLLDPSNHEQLSGRCPNEPIAILPQADQNSEVGGMVVMADRSVESLIMSPNTAYQSQSIGRPASHTLDAGRSASDRKSSSNSDLSSVSRKVGFQPADGPWRSIHTPNGTSILARGWIAQDEPAIFMLNDQLQQQWHYRMPLVLEKGSVNMVTACVDPESGQSFWAISQGNQVVHLVRGNGTLTDHFQLDETIRGLALIPIGKTMQLYIAHPRNIDIYSISAGAVR